MDGLPGVAVEASIIDRRARPWGSASGHPSPTVIGIRKRMTFAVGPSMNRTAQPVAAHSSAPYRRTGAIAAVPGAVIGGS